MNIPFCIIGIGKNISASFVTPEVALHLLTIYPVPLFYPYLKMAILFISSEFLKYP